MSRKPPDADDPLAPIVDDTPFVDRQLTVRPAVAGMRLDRYLATRFPGYSRASIQRGIADGTIKVDGRVVKPSSKLRAGQVLMICLPGAQGTEIPPEEIPLRILFEDDDFVVIDKDPHIVVHPARGNLSGTLVNGLVHHFAQLSDVGDPLRPGIVHRLDRDTSGVIVVAKDTQAHYQLAAQWEARTVQKEYLCLVESEPHIDEDTIDSPIGRHPRVREMQAIDPGGKSAQTRYAVEERLGGWALVRCFPRTGRTHQIRVHMLAIACPILCDGLYSSRERVTASELRGDVPPPDEEPILIRQALHAHRLQLDHPRTGQRMTFEAPLPADISAALEALRTRGDRDV